MTRRIISILLIILGAALLLATVSFWLDTLTSTVPTGLGEQIRNWLTSIIDLLTWISVYFLNRNNKHYPHNISVSGDNPKVLTGDNARNIQINEGNYIEKIEKLEIKITPPSDEDKEKNRRKYNFRNKHEFDLPRYLYKPIQDTVAELQVKLEKIKGGYIGVFGPPGSGKSTFLTETLRTLPVRLIRYYAYIPDAQDPSVLRGESINFFHDVTLKIQQLEIGEKEQPDPTDRIALIELLNRQLSLLGKDFESTGTRTVILVDGLDHIEREQHPERSLITDLPSPTTIPSGVYLIIGSQTKELTNLPISVRQALAEGGRTIFMGKLTPQNVFEIVHRTLPEMDNSFNERIYQSVDGHPLSLIYLLSALQSESPDNYGTILEKAVPYQGNIDEVYFSHWIKMESEQEFEKLMGLLARIRGPIPITWVAKWANEALLKKLELIFGQYFSTDELERWEFFHNSFRIFLEAKTGEALPGLSSEQIDKSYHLQLAEYYEKSENPWKWETLYHYYKAGDHKRVVDIATYDWFKSQVEALRPIDSIETDVRLAIKSAGELLDAVALTRYTLIGASLQQRSDILQNTQLPHLLIDAGKSNLSIDYARDGARLRLEHKSALSFCRRLYDADLRREATRVFELAEPLEYLSGNPISWRHAQPRNLFDLLSEWVESASLIRTPSETAQIVRRIRAEPLLNDESKNALQASLDLQNSLLRRGALGCAERDNWDGWQIFIDSLDERRDRRARYFTLLRSIEYLRQTNKNDRARGLLKELLDMAEPESFGGGRNGASNLLSIAESVYFLEFENYQSIAKKWFERLNVVPLSDKEISSIDHLPKLINLHFRYARLKFIYDENLAPEQLLREAESQTAFEEYEDRETILARRQVALIAYTLAKLWVDGHAGRTLEPTTFLNKTKWVFDLIESGWNSSSSTFRVEVDGAKEDISKYIVVCAEKHGVNALEAVKNEFGLRWKSQPAAWWSGIRREIAMSIENCHSDEGWARNQLEQIETFMLRGLDLYGRAEECEKQAKAWLSLGESAHAMAVLYQLVKCSRGVYSEKDYQLALWANWIRKVNKVESTTSSERVKKFLRQVLSVEETASGVDDALLNTLQAVFDISPSKCIRVYKNLLERKAIAHDEAIIKLLLSALESITPPVLCIYWIMENLLFPFASTKSPELIRKFFAKTSVMLGEKATVELSERIAERIRMDVRIDHRTGWLDGIYTGLCEIGADPHIVKMQLLDLEGETSSTNGTTEHRLNLLTGEELTLRDATWITSSNADLRSLLEKEARQPNSHFEWHKLATNLIKNTSTVEAINEICSLMESRIDGYSKETYLASVYTAASERCYQLGHIDFSRQLIQKAIELTRPSGWLTYWDGGIKHEAMRQMIKVIGKDARKEMLKLYVQDLTERYRYPAELIKSLDDIVRILFEDIPYSTLWPDIENYLDELFGGAIVEAQPELEAILDSSVETLSDDADNALAELLILYLDFPAFPVFNGAIVACSKAVLADSQAVKNALRRALTKHDQLVRQALITLEIVSLHKPGGIAFFQKALADLQKSPNIVTRMIATRILTNASGKSSYPPRVDHGIPAIYSLHLPDMTIHHTEDYVGNTTEPVLLHDPALLLQPFDIEAREIAGRANVPESNLLYHAIEKLKELEVQRTWLFNGLALEPGDLSVFLEKIHLRVSHNKPKIFPSRNSIAHIAAELYDAQNLSVSDLPYLEFIFRDYDPSLFSMEAKPRPDYVVGMGGLSYSMGTYAPFPKEWDQTLESSIPLLMSRTSDGRIILGEWTHLKRLESDWPTEERISLYRAVAPYAIWDGQNADSEKLPFASAIGLQTSDYRRTINHTEKELVIAHNGYRYQMGKANWLGLNPRVGFDMGWQSIENNCFSWKDKNNQLVVESIYWQDGNFDSESWYDYFEVGYGWLVLITEDGYQDMRRRYGAISRGGVIRRSLGAFGVKARRTISCALATS